jgi:hypothetical protein
MMPPSTHERLGPAHMPHAPPEQWSEPVHVPVVEPTSSVQHICMSVPQSLGVSMHMRIVGLHTEPSSHSLCGRHGSPVPPDVVSLPHVPPMHDRPPEHELPGMQHGWPALPHIIGATHVPPMQRSVEPAQPVAPSQHGWPSSPHASHVPEWQARPLLQVKPAQHIWPVAPQVAPGAGVVQRPVVQISPLAQSAEPVQPEPVGAVHWPPMHMRPVQQSELDEQIAPPGPDGMQQMSPRPQRLPVSHVRPVQHAEPPVPHAGAGPPPSGRGAPSGSVMSLPPPSWLPPPPAQAARQKKEAERRA